jgi:hypothetical protein
MALRRVSMTCICIAMHDLGSAAVPSRSSIRRTRKHPTTPITTSLFLEALVGSSLGEGSRGYAPPSERQDLCHEDPLPGALRARGRRQRGGGGHHQPPRAAGGVLHGGVPWPPIPRPLPRRLPVPRSRPVLPPHGARRPELARRPPDAPPGTRRQQAVLVHRSLSGARRCTTAASSTAA